MKNESCRAIINSAAFILKIFLASTGRVAVTEGGDLGDLGVIPQQAFWPVQSGQNRKTCICLHCLPASGETSKFSNTEILKQPHILVGEHW